MKRKDFLKKSALLTGAITSVSILKSSKDRNNIRQVGFNHLPNMETKTTTTILHKANTRGHADFGWLKANHTFSFANYYNPDRVNFGVLRVLNDDYIQAKMGFGKHPHDNMEIISIPIEGAIRHKDSMGNEGTIRKNEIQVMSAGTGIMHSEFNPLEDVTTNMLQIWIIPNKKQVEPRYDQVMFDEELMNNKFQQLLSPNKDDEGTWIHQNAWFHLGNLDNDVEIEHTINDNANGLYVFVIDGEIIINDQTLEKRDGYGLWNIESIVVKATKKAKVLIMEVPMEI